MGLHTIIISKQTGRGKYKPVGKIVCQLKGDRNSRPEPTPDELAEYVMQWIQYEIEETDDPGNYRMSLKGPAGKGRFDKSKHIDLRDEDGIARSKDMLNEGDMLEQQSAYIGELHSQLSGMVDLVLGSYKIVVGENREMMKILSEATRKHGDIEAQRMAHQLNLKIHEDEVAAEGQEAERSMQKFREALSLLKDTDAADQLVRAVARKIRGHDDAKNAQSETAKPATMVVTPTKANGRDDEEDEGTPKTKKTRFKKDDKTKKDKKSAKDAKGKKGKKGKRAKKNEEEPEEEEAISDELLEEGRRMVTERPLVTAAEALKMSIDQGSQWGIIRKTLSVDQADILDAIFASTTDEEVKSNAQLLFDAKGILNLAELREHLDEQQVSFISFVMKDVRQ